MTESDTSLISELELILDRFTEGVWDEAYVESDWTDRDAPIVVPDWRNKRLHSFEIEKGVPKAYVNFGVTKETADDLRTEGFIAFPKKDDRSRSGMQPSKYVMLREEDAPERAVEKVDQFGGVSKKSH